MLFLHLCVFLTLYVAVFDATDVQVSQRVGRMLHKGTIAQMMLNCKTNHYNVEQLPYSTKRNYLQWRKGAIADTSASSSMKRNAGLQMPSSMRATRELDKYLARRNAFLAMDVDMVVKGRVYDKSEDTLEIAIDEVYAINGVTGVPYVVLSDMDYLSILGTCHVSELDDVSNSASATASSYGGASNNAGATLNRTKSKFGDLVTAEEPSNDQQTLERFGIGTPVRALVIAVDVHSERVFLSLSNTRLGEFLSSHFRLGSCSPVEHSSAPGAVGLGVQNLGSGFASAWAVDQSPYMSPAVHASPRPESPYVGSSSLGSSYGAPQTVGTLMSTTGGSAYPSNSGASSATTASTHQPLLYDPTTPLSGTSSLLNSVALSSVPSYTSMGMHSTVAVRTLAFCCT